jgi:hypothetical protein
MIQKRWFIVVLVVVLSFVFEARANDPMGPPTAGLKKGQWRVSVEDAYSNIDIKADSIPEFDLTSATIKNVELNKVYGNIGVGLTDDLEIFLRLGGAWAKPDKGDNEDNLAGYIGSGDGFAMGGGAKATFAKSEDGKVKWGILAQMSWANLDFDESYSFEGETLRLTTQADVFEVQIAAGPTIQLTDCFSIYGGPFMRILDGNADIKGSIEDISAKTSTDLEQDSLYGGYIGAQLDITPRPDEVTAGAFLFGEGQFTGDGWGVAAGIGWKF